MELGSIYFTAVPLKAFLTTNESNQQPMNVSKTQTYFLTSHIVDQTHSLNDSIIFKVKII